MTGEQLYFKYQNTGSADYADRLLTIYMAIGEAVFDLLVKAEAANKQLHISAYPADSRIGDLSIDNIVLA